MFTCHTTASSLSMAETVTSKQSSLSTSSSMIFCRFMIKFSDFLVWWLWCCWEFGGADIPLMFHYWLFWCFSFFWVFCFLCRSHRVATNSGKPGKPGKTLFFKKSLKIWKSQKFFWKIWHIMEKSESFLLKILFSFYVCQ